LLALFSDPEDGGDMLLENICQLPMDYMALYPKKQDSSVITASSSDSTSKAGASTNIN
jgi:hypothetical protein